MNPQAAVQPTAKTASPDKPAVASNVPHMRVKIYSPYKTYFDEVDCQSVSGINKTGPFDILPHHHNFMTLLEPGELVIHYGSEVERIRISRGIMHVKADQVTVFLDV